MNAKARSALHEITSVLNEWSGPICVAFSGGKDSSAVIKLVGTALKRSRRRRKDIKIVYCDTGVENPLVVGFVKKTLRSLATELDGIGITHAVQILKPRIDQRFFVRVVGRGYPPPTQFFRWCTKDLRIRPVQRYLADLGPDALVVLGTRRGESQQRDRVLANGKKKGPFIQRQIDGGRKTSLYSPIINFDLEDVWTVLTEVPFPQSIDAGTLARLYRDGGGECPIVRDTNDAPCASARFGCWTCTVVRRDKSAERLIEAGHTELVPYHNFREWLSTIRNEPSLRCVRRRNGTTGMGPFTLAARRLILSRIRDLERAARKLLIDKKDEAEILRLWRIDQSSNTYLGSEP
jgi:DNA sulfur modification protein DndC